MISEGPLFLLFPSFSRHGHPCRDLCLLVSEAKPNPVGYQNKDVARGLSNQNVTFEKVGGEGSNITEFYPVDENGDKLSGEIIVQFYNEFGLLQEQYTWWLGEDIDEGYVDGWYDDDMEEAKARTLNFGEGFKVYTTYIGSGLVYAGEVDTDAVAVPVTRGLSSKGNIRPCAIKMSDVTPVTEDDEPVSGEITIQFYNEFGFLGEQYTWWLGEDIDEGYVDGWYDDDMEEVKDKDLTAGQGFCIYTTYTGAFLKFPAIGSK